MLKQPPLLHGLEDKDPETGVSWGDVRRVINQVAIDRGHYFGYPLPDDNKRIVMAPNTPIPGFDGFSLRETPDEELFREPKSREDLRELVLQLLRPGSSEDEIERLLSLLETTARPTYSLVNSWWSKQHQQQVVVWRDVTTGKISHTFERYRQTQKISLLLDTLGVARNWDHAAEARAMLKLQTHITPQAFHYYFTTGMFIETSPRSKLCYVFRRLRPTLAIRFLGDYDSVILAALCMHSLGHYEGTFGGVMVPTDDVIAHVLMMRSDERRFWSACNHHSLWDARCGL